ncbi:hypothetical protein CANARDRAFT_8650 [[Candida] arabinofermentans NRRL YB-2248]|uniref:Uncharacterized protein n=1 Tax=[Candida] arabinofermentans NRRL YB-2248 TaxID=983967 RepID=A0A1E4SXU3_9ASCO|nr:hypothetical protein CANARDRAFT_8650 [[Candida] arabinofermentans NRRL YB-2248]
MKSNPGTIFVLDNGATNPSKILSRNKKLGTNDTDLDRITEVVVGTGVGFSHNNRTTDTYTEDMNEVDVDYSPSYLDIIPEPEQELNILLT